MPVRGRVSRVSAKDNERRSSRVCRRGASLQDGMLDLRLVSWATEMPPKLITTALLCCFARHSELYIVRTFRKLDVMTVIGFNLTGV